MSYLHAVILGLVQGLTEFLPVSSSGHLVIFQTLLGFKEPPITFDIAVHMGTLIAVFAAFWPEIVRVVRHPFSRLVYLIIIGTIPAALMGMFLEPVFEKAFTSLAVVGAGLIITGFLLAVSQRITNSFINYKTERETSTVNALFIGIMQGIAITPGISRSGSTIAAGLLAGLDREFAASFSFLLSIPVILGAGLVEARDVGFSNLLAQGLGPYVVGMAVAAVSGYAAIRLVLGVVRQGKLTYFAYYCWAVGLTTLITGLLR